MNSLAGSFKRRLSTGLAAQAYNQAVTIGAQIVSVPILLSAWGAEQYGIWLLISAIPAYLTLADLGFAQVGASDMTMRMARGDHDSALTSYHTTFAVNCLIGLLLFGTLALFAFTPMSDALLGGDQMLESTRWALLALGGHALATLFRGVLHAGFRSVGKFSQAVTMSATVRLADMAVVLLVAVFGGSILHAAIGMLASASILTMSAALWFQTNHPSLRLGLSRANRAFVREMLPSSLHYLGFTLGNLITIQGSTIVIGAVLGPIAVAVANTVRTLARTGVTAANMLSQTLQTEYSATFASGNWENFRRLLRVHILAITCLMAAYAALMLTIGPLVYELWTHGELGNPTLLLGLMTVSIICDMAWTSLQTPAISTNRMRLTGATFFVAGICSVLSLLVLLPIFGLKAYGWTSLTISLSIIPSAMIELKRILRWTQ